MKKWFLVFSLIAMGLTAAALYRSGITFKKFSEEPLRGTLVYSHEYCSILNHIGVLDGINRSFCRLHFDKIGCQIVAKGKRTDGEIIGQDCRNRLCFTELTLESFECAGDRILCSDLSEYSDPYNCMCQSPLDCQKDECLDLTDHLTHIRSKLETDGNCPKGTDSISLAECPEGFILSEDRGETIGFVRHYYNTSKKLIGVYELSDYAEYCDRATMQKRRGQNFDCPTSNLTPICGTGK